MHILPGNCRAICILSAVVNPKSDSDTTKLILVQSNSIAHSSSLPGVGAFK